MTTKADIQRYWNDRARDSTGETRTTNDYYLRQLEIATLNRVITGLPVAVRNVLDIGCGDGLSTLQVAKRFPEAQVIGADYSDIMLAAAAKNLAAEPQLATRVTFRRADVCDLRAALPNRAFDVVISDRCLINLPTMAEQSQAVGEIHKVLVAGGFFLAIENFLDGQEELNRARAGLGLDPIPVRWHNRFFTAEELRSIAEPHFRIVQTLNFASAYYFATRLVYSALCKEEGVQPDYLHPVHKLATNLPEIGNFSPIKLVVMQKVA